MDKDYERIVKRLADDYGWHLDRLEDNSGMRALVDYTIQACKAELINTPVANEFIEGVKTEMAHHGEKWGDESDKPPHHFQMVLSYLNGKLALAIWDRDVEKFKHHLETMAAVAGTTFKYLFVEGAENKKWFKQNG